MQVTPPSHSFVDTPKKHTHLKIGIFQFWNVSPHLETSLEIALKESLQNNTNVFYFFLGDQISYNECYQKPRSGKLPRQSRAKYLTDHLLSWVNHMPCGFIPVEVNEFNLQSISHLKRVSYKHLIIGEYLYCALIDYTKSPSPNPQKFKPILDSMFSTFVTVYENVTKLIHHYQLDQIITFNGRHIPYAAVACAANDSFVSIRYHERGGSNDRYLLMDSKVHSVEKYQALLKQAWHQKKCTDEQAYERASSIITKSVDGRDPTYNRYRVKQKRNALPSVDASITNIGFYASSIDENSMIPNRELYPFGFWEDQRSAVLDLITRSIKSNTRAKIYVRLHPNLEHKKEELSLWDFLSILPANIVEVIAPNHSADSYELCNHMDINIVYHSSIGPEIMYLGNPIYAFNTCRYDYIHGCTIINGISDLDNIIDNHDRLELNIDIPRMKLEALKHIYCMHYFGIDYEYYEPKDNHSGRFLGVKL